MRSLLNTLLKKDVKWSWSNNCQKAFQDIKKKLISDLSLAHFDPAAEFIVAAGAYKYGVGAVLLQKYKDGNMKVVVHASHSLIAEEKH